MRPFSLVLLLGVSLLSGAARAEGANAPPPDVRATVVTPPPATPSAADAKAFVDTRQRRAEAALDPLVHRRVDQGHVHHRRHRAERRRRERGGDGVPVAARSRSRSAFDGVKVDRRHRADAPPAARRDRRCRRPTDPAKRARARRRSPRSSRASTARASGAAPRRRARPRSAAATCRTLEEVLAKSRNYDELLDAWAGWHTISPRDAPAVRAARRARQRGREGDRLRGPRRRSGAPATT